MIAVSFVLIKEVDGYALNLVIQIKIVHYTVVLILVANYIKAIACRQVVI